MGLDECGNQCGPEKQKSSGGGGQLTAQVHMRVARGSWSSLSCPSFTAWTSTSQEDFLAHLETPDEWEKA